MKKRLAPMGLILLAGLVRILPASAAGSAPSTGEKTPPPKPRKTEVEREPKAMQAGSELSEGLGLLAISKNLIRSSFFKVF